MTKLSLEGKVFGKLTVVGYEGEDNRGWRKSQKGYRVPNEK